MRWLGIDHPSRSWNSGAGGPGVLGVVLWCQTKNDQTSAVSKDNPLEKDNYAHVAQRRMIKVPRGATVRASEKGDLTCVTLNSGRRPYLKNDMFEKDTYASVTQRRPESTTALTPLGARRCLPTPADVCSERLGCWGC